MGKPLFPSKLSITRTLIHFPMQSSIPMEEQKKKGTEAAGLEPAIHDFRRPWELARHTGLSEAKTEVPARYQAFSCHELYR